RHYPDQDEVVRVRAAIRAPLVSGMGFVPFTLGEVGPSSAGKGDAVTTGSRSLSNAYLDVRADAGGAITLTDRRNGERYAGLLELVSETDAGDAYTFCPGLPRRTARASGPVSIRKLATGPLVGALELRYFLKPHSGLVRVRVVLMLYADSPVLRCVVELDNQARDHRVRVRFPTGIETGETVAGAPFGQVRRGLPASRVAGATEAPARTAPAHRFVAATAGARGLALLAPGFFEYEWAATGDLWMTLLRAIG